MNSEKEDLDNLTKHPGWLRLKAYVEKLWQDELTSHLRNAVSDTNDANALQKMRQIIVAKDAVERLVKWPEERLARLKEQGELTSYKVVVPTRGGYVA